MEIRSINTHKDMKNVSPVYLFAIFFLLIFMCGCTPELSVGELKCEFLTDPLAIDNASPNLSWKMTAGQNGVSSSAYQILVATDKRKLNEKDADLWNSGRIEDPDVVMASYVGKSLKSKDLAWWKVRVWNQDGEPSGWSAPAFFGIGLMDEKDWDSRAAFIGLADNEKAPEAAPMLRSAFEVGRTGSRMLLHVNSLGYHHAYINGRPVSDAVLNPAVSEYDTRSLIVTYDVTGLIRKGRNEILLWLGKGWYQDHTEGVAPGGPYVRAQLDAVSSDGAATVLVTDENWTATESDRRSFGNWKYRKLGGEIVDSRMSIPDFKTSTLDALDWEPVCTADVPVRKASPQMCELNRIQQTIHPVSVHQVADSSFIYDLGTTLTGFTQVKMPAVADGLRVELHYEDLYLNDLADFRDGTYTDYYIGNGSAEGEFSSRFNYKAYRYLKIKGLPQALPLEDITASAIRTDYDSDAWFECSDKDMNDIYQMIHRTVYALTLGGDMVDCPHRERLGYGGDGNASTPTVQTIADLAPLYFNWLQAYADSQSEDGDLPHTAPNPYRAGGGPYWCMFLISASWHSYVNYADRRMMERFYPNMQKWIDFAESSFKDGLLKEWGPSVHRHWYLGDWATSDGIEQKDPLSVDLVSNCVMSHSYEFMEKIARALGKESDARRYARRKEMQNALIHKTFYNETDSTYSTGTQIDMIYPMLVGAVPESCIEAVKAALFRETARRFKGHISTGLVGIPVLTQWVTQEGETEFMYNMLKKRGYPGYLYMIDNGAVTTWEHWSGIKSQIHNCFNGIGSWFYQALAGICPDEAHPGFAHVLIRPQLTGGIDWVKAHRDTPYGRLGVKWKLGNGSFMLSLDIPVGSSATIYLPDGSEGISVGSGHYDFSCSLRVKY